MRFVGMNGMDSSILILSILAKHSGTCIRILSVENKHLVEGCSQLLRSRSAFGERSPKLYDHYSINNEAEHERSNF